MANIAARGKATLKMKITRRDGTVEYRDVPMEATRDENGQIELKEINADGRHIHERR